MLIKESRTFEYEIFDCLRFAGTEGTIRNYIFAVWKGLLTGSSYQPLINTLRPRRYVQHFAEDISKRILLNENAWIPVIISLKYVSKGPIINIPALVQIMAWRRSGDNPLSEPMIVDLPTHICVTRTQWVINTRKKRPVFWCSVLCGYKNHGPDYLQFLSLL